jgi:hypothetical protein
MDVRNGFIVGVYNYCDRWCEHCPFTGRCRVFADGREIDFELASGKSVKQAVARLHARIEASMPPDIDPDDDEGDAMAGPGPRWELPAAHADTERCALDYGRRVWKWLQAHPLRDVHRPGAPDALAVVAHFGILLGAKVYRALGGLSMEVDERYDANGSAKVVLVGIERSHAAWLDLVLSGQVSDADAAPFIADLVRLGEGLERLFPHARSFIRPAFDEPEAVARLEAGQFGE